MRFSYVRICNAYVAYLSSLDHFSLLILVFSKFLNYLGNKWKKIEILIFILEKLLAKNNCSIIFPIIFWNISWHFFGQKRYFCEKKKIWSGLLVLKARWGWRCTMLWCFLWLGACNMLLTLWWKLYNFMVFRRY